MLEQLKNDREAWLGKRGFVVGDGGFGLGAMMLVPYRSPSNKMQKYFNFCISSTRFFVEETFGRWKNCFHQLQDYQYCNQRHMCWIILSTMICHNMCQAFRDDSPADIADADKNPLGKEFMQRRCEACFRTMPVGLQQGLCKLCERKERAQCRHGLHTVVSLSDKMAERRRCLTRWQRGLDHLLRIQLPHSWEPLTDQDYKFRSRPMPRGGLLNVDCF
eukprot:441777-Rhodomonas_salina.2